MSSGNSSPPLGDNPFAMGHHNPVYEFAGLGARLLITANSPSEMLTASSVLCNQL